MTELNKTKILREMVRLMERKLGVLEEGEMACCGISLAQCHALVEIGRAGRLSLIELSNLLNLDNSTMSRTVNNLVAGGMAERETDPSDRRYVTIGLTENGLRSFREIEDSMNTYFDAIFRAIPDGKQEQVLESLQLLLDAITASDCC